MKKYLRFISTDKNVWTRIFLWEEYPFIFIYLGKSKDVWSYLFCDYPEIMKNLVQIIVICRTKISGYTQFDDEAARDRILLARWSSHAVDDTAKYGGLLW